MNSVETEIEPCADCWRPRSVGVHCETCSDRSGAKTMAHPAVYESVEKWIKKHWRKIESWEGEITEEGWSNGNLSGWLPTYNRGVYIIGMQHPECHDGCEGVPSGPDGIVTCNPWLKIGRAQDVYTRLASIRTSSPLVVSVLALMPFDMPEAREREAELHRIFRPYRVDRSDRYKCEWFWNNAALEHLWQVVYDFGGDGPG